MQIVATTLPSYLIERQEAGGVLMTIQFKLRAKMLYSKKLMEEIIAPNLHTAWSILINS